MSKEVKRKVISLATKIEILDRLRKGDRVVDTPKSYSMNKATIRTIRTNENTIRKSVAAGNTTSMGRTSYTKNLDLHGIYLKIFNFRFTRFSQERIYRVNRGIDVYSF